MVVAPSWKGQMDAMDAYRIARDGTQLPEVRIGGWVNNSSSEGVAVAGDGSFYLAGWASGTGLRPFQSLGPFSAVVGAFDAEGQPLPGFGKDGVLAGSFNANFQVEAIQVQTDGKVLLAGAKRGKNQAMVIKRLTKSGKLDRSFSGDGSASLPMKRGGEGGFVDLELTRGGKILAIGRRDGKVVLVRFKRNGNLDRKFGKNGTALRKVVEDRNCWVEDGCWDSDMTVEPAGSIVAISPKEGKEGRFAVETPVLHRISPTGRLLKSWTLPKIGGRTLKFANTLVRQRDGKLVLIGVVGKPAKTVAAVVRLRKDGKPDRAFGKKGIKILPQIGDPSDGMITSDGKIVVSGKEKLTGPASALTIVRLEG